MGNRIAKAAFGDSAVARRNFRTDSQLQKAAELLRKGSTQRDVFIAAGVPLPKATPASGAAAQRPRGER